jgi:hypothetical protein
MRNFTKLALTALVISVLNGCGGTTGGSSSSNSYSGGKTHSNKTAGVNLRSLSVDYQDYHNVILSWDPVDGATDYEVHIAQNMLLLDTTYPITVGKTEVNLGKYIFQRDRDYWISVKAKGSNQSAVTTVTMTEDSATL